MLQTDGHAVTDESELTPTNGDLDLEDVEFDPERLDDDDGYDDWSDDDEAAHATVHSQAVAEWGDRRARVDVEMAPLVTEVWRAGLETFSSCQDLGESLADLRLRLPHMARYVESCHRTALLDVSPPDAQPLLDLIAAAGPTGAMYDRMTRWTAEGAWKYGLVMLDFPGEDGSYSFQIFAIQVKLPRSDIGEVTECLRLQNDRLDTARRDAAARTSDPDLQ